MNYKEYKERAFKANPELKAEYDALAPQYEVIREVIKARIEKQMTQRELAEKVHTAQSNISRLESGSYNPSVAFLKKVADALDKDLVISLK